MAESLNIHSKDLYDSMNSHRRGVFHIILSSFIRHSNVIDWKKNEKMRDENIDVYFVEMHLIHVCMLQTQR